MEATEPVSPPWHKIRPTSPECLHMKASPCVTPRGGILVGHQAHTPGHQETIFPGFPGAQERDYRAANMGQEALEGKSRRMMPRAC